MEKHIFITNFEKTKLLVRPLSCVFSLWQHFTVTENKKKTCKPAPSRLVRRTMHGYARIIMGTARQNKLVGMANIRTGTWSHTLAPKSFPRCSLYTPWTCRSAFSSTEWGIQHKRERKVLFIFWISVSKWSEKCKLLFRDASALSS